MAESSELNPRGPAAIWLERLAESERVDKLYHDKCDSIDRLYSDLERLAGNRADREFQLFWANQEVMRPTVFSRAPVPQATSRFKDRKELPRRAADLIERALISDVEADDLFSTLVLVRDDLVNNARGVVWLKVINRDGIEVPCAYHVNRQDFRHSVARKWQEVTWAARRTWNTKEETIKRFKSTASPQSLSEVSYNQQTIGGKTEGPKKAEIWEVWDKTSRQVLWVSQGVGDFLDKRKAWLNLTGFFPCPRPAYGTLQRDTLIPVPDMVYYKDQLEEINELTCRMGALQQGLRLRGIYASGTPEISEAFERAMRNMDPRTILEPVPMLGNMAIADLVLWMPLDMVAGALEACVGMRKQLIDDVYQITGLSDITRGSTEPQETATAQRLKSEYGAVRLREKQGEMVRISRDVIRLKAEIMAESVPIDDLLVMAQIDDLPREADLMKQAEPIVQQAQQAMMAALQTGDDQAGMQAQQQAQQALDQLKQTVTVEKIGALLRDQRIRPFVIDVETDSTIEPDQAAEKEARVEFATAMGSMIPQVVQGMQAAPQLAPLLAEFVRFTASGFKIDRRMDEAIDKAAEALEGYQPPEEGPKDDPQVAMLKVEAEKVKAEAAKVGAEADIQVAGMKVQSEQAKSQMNQLEAEETAAKTDKLKAETMKIMSEVGIEREKAQIDLEGQRSELRLKSEQADIDRKNSQAEFQLKHEDQKARMRMDREKMEHEARTRGALPPAKRTRRTKVTKHDDRGRILEFESSDE